MNERLRTDHKDEQCRECLNRWCPCGRGDLTPPQRTNRMLLYWPLNGEINKDKILEEIDAIHDGKLNCLEGKYGYYQICVMPYCILCTLTYEFPEGKVVITRYTNNRFYPIRRGSLYWNDRVVFENF